MTTERPVSPRQGGDARGAQSDPPPSYGSLSSRVDDGTSHDVGIADAIAMGGMVERSLQKRFPTLSSDDVHDAVIDALLAVTCRPGRNGEWAALEWRYVYRAAFCNASNMAASAKARERREQRWWAQLKDQAGSSDEGDRQATLETACRKISDALPDSRMRTVFRLWASGERAATTFAAAIDLEALSEAGQRDAITREKDRLRKYIQRSQAIAEIASNALHALDACD